MFEYKSDVAVLHGAFLSALEQQRNSENEESEMVHADLCGLSDECLTKACKLLTDAITSSCAKNVRKKSSADGIDTKRRLHAAIFHSLLSSNGFTNSEPFYFEAVENIFPKIDWKFYYYLIESAHLKIYFVDVASCLQDDLCIFVLDKTLQYITKCEKYKLIHSIQEIILKKHLFHLTNPLKDIGIGTIDQYDLILKDSCKIFLELWKKCISNDEAIGECASLFIGTLSLLQGMCDTILEQLANSFSSVAEVIDENAVTPILAGLNWHCVLTNEVYVVLTDINLLFDSVKGFKQLSEHDNTKILKVVEESRDALELTLYCANVCGLVQNLEDLDKLKIICDCLKNIFSFINNEEKVVDDWSAKVKRHLERVNGLKKLFIEKRASQNHNFARFWEEMYLRAEEETISKLLRICVSCEDAYRLNLIEVLLLDFDHLNLRCKQNILSQRMELGCKPDALKLPNFINALTTCLNQAAVECKDIFQEILKLGLQSPQDTLKRVVVQALANSGQIEILVQMLIVLHPICAFHHQPTSNSLLVEIFKDLLSSDLTEKQLQNLLSIVKLLLNVDTNQEALKIEQFIHSCILSHLNINESTVTLGIILQLFQHICRFTRSTAWSENIAAVPVVFCLCQLIDNCIYQGDGNRKGQVLQTLAAFKEVSIGHLKLQGSKMMQWAALSPVAKLHALDFFNIRKFYETADVGLSLIMALGSDSGDVLKEKMFSGVNHHHKYSLLATGFTQILPHLTLLEWENLCSFALNVLKSQDVKDRWTMLDFENYQVNASEVFLVKCINDALVLISEHRQAPVSWTHVLYCYSISIQRIVASNPSLTVMILCEVCRLASSLTEDIANNLLVSLLELSQGVHTNKLVCAAVNTIPHRSIRASLSEIATRT